MSTQNGARETREDGFSLIPPGALARDHGGPLIAGNASERGMP